jgi:hypothetical protein
MDNCFKIFALGEDFDVATYQDKSTMAVSRIWRRGEPKGGRGSPYPTSGVEYEIGEGNALSFFEQERLAIEFIKAHRDELSALGQFPGVTHFTLGLQYSNVAQGNLVGFALAVSPCLMWHLLDIRCSLTNYVWLQYPDAEEA